MSPSANDSWDTRTGHCPAYCPDCLHCGDQSVTPTDALAIPAVRRKLRTRIESLIQPSLAAGDTLLLFLRRGSGSKLKFLTSAAFLARLGDLLPGCCVVPRSAKYPTRTVLFGVRCLTECPRSTAPLAVASLPQRFYFREQPAQALLSCISLVDTLLKHNTAYLPNLNWCDREELNLHGVAPTSTSS